MLSFEVHESRLSKLRVYLEGLHNSLDIVESGSQYSFNTFALDEGWVEDAGEEAAVNRELETRLGSRARGPIEFTERGPEVEGLVDVLRLYLTKFPNNVLLEKWLDDSLEGAINTYKKTNTPVRFLIGSFSLQLTCSFIYQLPVDSSIPGPNSKSAGAESSKRKLTGMSAAAALPSNTKKKKVTSSRSKDPRVETAKIVTISMHPVLNNLINFH
jgi:hypothetical protein